MREKCVRLGPDAAEELAALEQRCFALPWSGQQLAAALRQSFFTALGLRPGSPAPLAEAGNKPLTAYISFYHHQREVEILNLAVLPVLRRAGRGTRLLCLALRLAVQAGAERAILEVRESNIPALRLYRSFGFTQIGRRPRYYGNEDALVLERKAEIMP